MHTIVRTEQYKSGHAAYYHAHVHSLPFNNIVILYKFPDGGGRFMSGMDNPRMILLEAQDEEAFQTVDLWF
jgi:hypothetical protein